MHSKQKGNVGELAVALNLSKRGYPVFAELGDNSKVDLIVLVDDQPIKVQVKYCGEKEKVFLYATKDGPNYHFKYKVGQVDVFALYSAETDQVAYVNANWFIRNYNKTLTLRLVSSSSSNQHKGVHWFSEFTSFEEALRGHTEPTLTDNAEGEEMVQTTTEK